jgi:hypothetical protein
MIRNESGASFYLWWIVVCGRIPIPRLIKQARRLALLCFASLVIQLRRGYFFQSKHDDLLCFASLVIQ